MSAVVSPSRINKKAELWQRWLLDAPYIWYPENFRESPSTPTTTFPEIFNGLLFRSILRMCVQNLKFVALPIPEIIGSTQKIGQSLDTYRLPFLQSFYGILFGWTPGMYQPNLKSVALPIPEIIAIEILGLRTPNLGEDEAVGGRGWSRSKERWWFPIDPP